MTLSPIGRCFKLGILASVPNQSLVASSSKLVDVHFKILIKQNQIRQKFHIIWGSFLDHFGEEHVQVSKIYIQSQQGIR